MGKFLQFFFFVTSIGVTLPSEDPIKKYLEYQTKVWCRSNPFGLLFTKGQHVECSDKGFMPSEDFGKEILNNVTLNVGTLEIISDRDYDCGVKLREGKWTTKNDYTNYIVKLLQDVLRFEINYKVPTGWLEEAKSDREALVRLMESNITDLTVCHWPTTEVYSKSVDHLLPTLKTSESFVFVPSNLPLAKDVFLGTFSLKLWIFFFLAIFILTVSFKFSTCMHSKVRPDHEPWSWDEVVLWAVATVSQQSYSRHPRGSSCRTMFLIGYTISYLLYTGFAAGITSLLALNGHRNKLSFADIDSKKLTLLFHRDEYYLDFLENNLKFTSRFPAHLMRREFEDLPGIFFKISQENFVGYGTTISFVSYLRNVNPENRDIFYVYPIPSFYRQKSFLIRKPFPFKNLFNYWLMKFIETGLLDAGIKRFSKGGETIYKTSSWLSADLGNVFSAIVFLVGGWILSVIILILEIIWWNKKKRMKNNTGKGLKNKIIDLNKSFKEVRNNASDLPKMQLFNY